MGKKLTRLVSVERSNRFGQVVNGTTNRILKAIWSASGEGVEEVIQLVSQRTVYGGNLVLPDKYGTDDAALAQFKADVQALIDKGLAQMYGYIFTVAQLTDNEHTKVKNISNGHVIEAFPRAWLGDDEKSCFDAVRRDLQKAVEKTLVWED